MLKPALIAMCLLVVPACCHAKNNCPWLNEATASGLLGGAAVGDFTAAAPGTPAVCTFVRQDAGATRTLRITVEIAAGTASALRRTCAGLRRIHRAQSHRQ